MTLGSIRLSVLQKARLVDGNGNILGAAVSIPQVNSLIIEAMEEVTQKTNMPEIYGTTTWPVTNPATQEVKLPQYVNKLLRVYLNGQLLKPTSIIELNQEKNLLYVPHWQTYVADAPPTFNQDNLFPISQLNADLFKYYFRNQQPISMGLNIPCSLGAPLTIDYVQLPQLPATDSVPLNYPHDFQSWIVQIALTKLFRTLKKHEDADKSIFDLQRMEKGMVKNRSEIQSQFFNPLTPMPYIQHFRF